MVLDSIFTPFSYAIENQGTLIVEETPVIEITETEEELVEEETVEESPEEIKEDASEEIQTPEEIALVGTLGGEDSEWWDTQTWDTENLTWWETNVNTWNNSTWWDTQTWDTENLTWWETSANTWNNSTWWNTQTWDIQNLTWWETNVETWTNQTENTGTVINWEEWVDFEDIVYTWIASGWMFTITLMDRNLWATLTWIWKEAEIESYGNYYQWWNGYPFSYHKERNQYTNEMVDASWYGPNNWYVWNKFIKWHNDWSSVINNNLWWWERDNEENDYNDESNRQWPCPEWYHVPSVWEWHALLTIYEKRDMRDIIWKVKI